MEHDNYFKLKDDLIPLLPEPERKIYKQFRLVEQEFSKFHGKLVVNGRNAIQETASRLNINEQDVKLYVLSASKKLQRMLNDPHNT